jgi:hypothetical protein
MTIWYILCSFGTFLPVLVSCTKKNLATLLPTKNLSRIIPIFLTNVEEGGKKSFQNFCSEIYKEEKSCLIRPGNGVMIKKISTKNLRKNLCFFCSNHRLFCKNLVITMVFEKNAHFFRRKSAKIAENCDHNIDPCLLFKNLKLNI